MFIVRDFGKFVNGCFWLGSFEGTVLIDLDRIIWSFFRLLLVPIYLFCGLMFLKGPF